MHRSIRSATIFSASHTAFIPIEYSETPGTGIAVPQDKAAPTVSPFASAAAASLAAKYTPRPMPASNNLPPNPPKSVLVSVAATLVSLAASLASVAPSLASVAPSLASVAPALASVAAASAAAVSALTAALSGAAGLASGVGDGGLVP